MEISQNLIYELLLWCVDHFPEKEKIISVESVTNEDVEGYIKSIDTSDSTYIKSIIFHLEAMQTEGYFVETHSSKGIMGISIKGQKELDRLRAKSNTPKKATSRQG